MEAVLIGATKTSLKKEGQKCSNTPAPSSRRARNVFKSPAWPFLPSAKFASAEKWLGSIRAETSELLGVVGHHQHHCFVVKLQRNVLPFRKRNHRQQQKSRRQNPAKSFHFCRNYFSRRWTNEQFVDRPKINPQCFDLRRNPNSLRRRTRQNFIALFEHSTFTVRYQNTNYSGYNWLSHQQPN